MDRVVWPWQMWATWATWPATTSTTFPLEPEEELDSDEIRNDDGDEVVDPPEEWIEAKDNETLDERLAEEVPDDLGDDEDVGAQRRPRLGRRRWAQVGQQLRPRPHGRGKAWPRNADRSMAHLEEGDSFYDVIE